MVIRIGTAAIVAAIIIHAPQVTFSQEYKQDRFVEQAIALQGENTTPSRPSSEAEGLFNGTGFIEAATEGEAEIKHAGGQAAPKTEGGAEETIFADMSVFFTAWERGAIANAKALRGMVRPIGDGEVENEWDGGAISKPPPEERNITLNGIVYNAVRDWTIWLNGKRFTPDALPREAIDIKVYKEYIEVEWYDEYTQRILPIRLRANQRFNIDTRIFLPG
ncbi:MAG: hypothetical protein ACRBCT_07310 [Alphaproteobacteria bacterium]